MDYCDVFIRLSFWRHPFTAEHPLLRLRHWCNATFLQTWWRNKLIYILYDLRVSTCCLWLSDWLLVELIISWWSIKHFVVLVCCESDLSDVQRCIIEYICYDTSLTISWWSGVDYWDVFICCLDSHSDGTHSLQSIHCWDTDATLHFSKSDEETNSSTSCMTWEWVHFKHIFIFWGELLLS